MRPNASVDKPCDCQDHINNKKVTNGRTRDGGRNMAELCGRAGAQLARRRSYAASGNTRSISRRATNRVVRARGYVAEGAYARAGPHLYSHRIVRTRLGARTRI